MKQVCADKATPISYSMLIPKFLRLSEGASAGSGFSYSCPDKF